MDARLPALLQLYYCFTTALIQLYYCCTTAVLYDWIGAAQRMAHEKMDASALYYRFYSFLQLLLFTTDSLVLNSIGTG